MTAVGSMKHLVLGATTDGAKAAGLKNKFPYKKPQMAEFKTPLNLVSVPLLRVFHSVEPVREGAAGGSVSFLSS